MLHELLNALEAHYGTPGLMAAGGPLDMILWENVTSLVNQERRKSRVQASKQQTYPETDPRRKKSLQKITQLVMELFGGDINRLLELPIDQARKALQLFPGIDESAAEKILLFQRRLPVFALDPNGLRALVRIGFGHRRKTYSETYHCVQDAVQAHVISDFNWLIRAHHLLRMHGQEVCRPRMPRCSECPVRNMCAYARSRVDA